MKFYIIVQNSMIDSKNMETMVVVGKVKVVAIVEVISWIVLPNHVSSAY